jgi:hypothetical protein
VAVEVAEVRMQVITKREETVTFWVDLRTAQLIADTLNTASQTTTPASNVTLTSTPAITVYLPQAKMGQGNYILVRSANGTNYYGLEFLCQ